MRYKPENEVELSQIVAEAKLPFDVVGTGTKRGLGRLTENPYILDLSKFSGVKVYEPEELILEVGAATKLSDIEKLIATHNQYLAFEPPDYSKLLGSKHSGTIGGILACNLSGPRRIKMGAARDHILGLQAVSGRGEVFKAGARVVKNVTGYDVPKLMAGSYGTLAAFTSMIFKVLPKPESEATLVIHGLDDASAVLCMSAALQSTAEVSGAAHLPNVGTFLRLEGIEPSIIYRRDKLILLLNKKIETLNSTESAVQWRNIRDVQPLTDNTTHMVWKICVAPSEAPLILAKLKAQFEFRYFLDWAGGLIWLGCTEEKSSEIRAAIGLGHASLIRAPADTKKRLNVLQPQPPALAALSARVKNSFDPRGLFNPGRMYEGV